MENFLVENLVDYGKFPWSIFCGKFLWSIILWKPFFGFFVSIKSLFVKTFFDQGKIYLMKFFLENFFVESFLTVENFLDQTFCWIFPWSILLWKTSLAMENFLNQIFCGKFPWLNFLWDIFLIKCFVENFLDQRKFPWPWKNSEIKEIFLDCGKRTLLTAKIISLIILKRLRHIF